MSESAITITGVEELSRNLKMLATKVQKKVLRKAMRVAAKPLKAEMERRAFRAPGGPTYPHLGHFADNIEIGTSIRKSGALRLKVGPKAEHWHANFVEYGTPRAGARPFMRPAMSKEQQVYDDFEYELWRGIKEELQYLGLS